MFSRFSRWIRFNWMYFRQPAWDTGITPPEVLAFLVETAPGKALDLGCGTGTNLLTLADHGWQVWGVDFAVAAVQRARQRLKAANQPAVIYAGDVTNMAQIQERFDLVLDIGCLHGVMPELRARYFANLKRWLAPRGHYLLYAFTSSSAGSFSAGLVASDLAWLHENLSLISQVDGTERGQRPSSWFHFRAL